MTSVLVTGAAGFVGRRVVAALGARGFAVEAHRRTDGDLAEPEVAKALLTRHAWDAVINLAGPVTGGSETDASARETVAAHVRIALNIGRWAGAAKVVHASSMTVYGLPVSLPILEDHPRHPLHLYGVGKMLAEDILADRSRDVWLLRLPGLFAEERATGALFHFCRAAREGRPLRVNAAAPTPWDILHVDDAVTAICAAVASPRIGTGALNISYGDPVDLVSVARTIVEISGGSSPVEPGEALHPSFQLDIRKAREMIGWNPPTLHSRLRELYAHYAS